MTTIPWTQPAAGTRTNSRVTRGCVVSRAFTLVELLLVVIIIGIAAGIAAPRYAGAITRYRVESAACRIAADLAMAQGSARSSSAGRTVQFDTALGRYRVVGVASFDNSAASYTVDLTSLPYEVTLESAVLGGNAEVTFDGFGVPDSGGQVVVRAGTFGRAVFLEAVTGRTSIGSP
jgi:type II secretion system protein H